jgi:PAT family beta-lactamase induction signal transducer AmpG
MRDIGLDIRIVGLFTLAQAPWSFKVLWSPLMDRYVPPFWGRRRGWIAIAQVALFLVTLGLSGVGHHPEAPWVVGALALAMAVASATQDIAFDAYAVDVLRREEYGPASGARVAFYRAAMALSGGLTITLAQPYGWPAVNALLASSYLLMLLLTWKAPDPEERILVPSSLRDAVWKPFLGFLSRHRALEILAFVFFYKFADQLAQALTRPFLNDMGYNELHRGFALATVGMAATIVGTFIGGIATTLLGLGHSLWIFGVLQIFSNLGYYLVARSPVSLPLMYGATGFELFTSGLGTGAYSVLLLRLTQKRFSATQYALFSSLFGLPRILGGPVCGFLADAFGWADFFLITLAFGLPGMALLYRFVPIGVREPEFAVEPPRRRARLTYGGLALRGTLGALLGMAGGILVVTAMSALREMRGTPGVGFDVARALAPLVHPTGIGGVLEISGIVTFGVICGLFTAAVFAARHGAGSDAAPEEEIQEVR